MNRDIRHRLTQIDDQRQITTGGTDEISSVAKAKGTSVQGSLVDGDTRDIDDLGNALLDKKRNEIREGRTNARVKVNHQPWSPQRIEPS